MNGIYRCTHMQLACKGIFGLLRKWTILSAVGVSD